MRIEHDIEIAAPPERVWDLTADVESWPTFTPTMTKVERLDDGPIGAGSRARVTQPGQRPRVWTVTDFEPPERFAWSTRAMGTSMTGSHVIEASANGVTNRLAVDVDGPLAFIVGPLIRRPIRSAIRRENEGFKSAAES